MGHPINVSLNPQMEKVKDLSADWNFKSDFCYKDPRWTKAFGW